MRRTRRRGTSLLETIIAIVVLSVVLIPIANTFSTLRSGFTKVSRNAVAIGLARAVLDHIHYKLYDDDTRFADVLASDAEKVLAVQNGEAKTFFSNLAETEKSVTCEDIGALSPYFNRINDLTKSGAFGITPENDIDLYNQLKTYRCSVDVYFSTPTDLLDSDVDGQSEPDMAEIKVTLSWDEGDQRRSLELWSVFTKRQYNEVK